MKPDFTQTVALNSSLIAWALVKRQLTVRATPKNCSVSPEQFGAKLDRNGEGAVDDQRQGHTMSRQLTREARKSFRRRANIKLVCIASPTSKSPNQVVSNAVASCYCGCPNAEAVAGEVALNPRGRENLPQPIGQDFGKQRLTICKKEQGAGAFPRTERYASKA